MTQIVSTVDFDRDGKQIGWLHVPHSVTRSAYGVLPIPVAVIRNGPGPQVLLTAGNHGDEYEGQVVLTRLIQEVQPEQIRGGLIIIPALNQPAVLAAARVSPLDAGNLNRVFPGDPGGGPTWKIADYVEQHTAARGLKWWPTSTAAGPPWTTDRTPAPTSAPTRPLSTSA